MQPTSGCQTIDLPVADEDRPQFWRAHSGSLVLSANVGHPHSSYKYAASPSLTGVRAAALAGLAITPLPASELIAGMRILGVEEGLPQTLALGPSRPAI
jgi:hypothetical protein